MLHYWKADCRRIMKRIPRLLLLAAVILIDTLIFIRTAGEGGWNSATCLSHLSNLVGFMPIFFGMIELSAVYGDDFRARIMQVAIGLGISREKVVLTKYLESAFLLFTDYLFFGVYFLILSKISGVSMNAGQLGELAVGIGVAWLLTLVYMGVTGILTINQQGTGASILLYLALSTTIIRSLLDSLLNLKAIRGLHLSQYLLSTASDLFRSRLLLGTFDVRALVTVLCYLVGAYAATVLLFRHKELEF